jgi:hypothetical protein
VILDVFNRIIGSIFFLDVFIEDIICLFQRATVYTCLLWHRRACVGGNLLEVNERLVSNPALLSASTVRKTTPDVQLAIMLTADWQAHWDGFICVIMPSFRDTQRLPGQLQEWNHGSS